MAFIRVFFICDRNTWFFIFILARSVTKGVLIMIMIKNMKKIPRKWHKYEAQSSEPQKKKKKKKKER